MADDPFDNYSNEPEYEVGVSDTTILIISVVGFGVMTVLVYFIIVARTKSADELENDDGNDIDYEEELLKADVKNLNRAQRRARAKALMKRQRRAPNSGTDAPLDRNDENNNNDQLALMEEEGGENDDLYNSATHLSRKERNAAAKATERKARHLLEEERREDQRRAMQTAKEEKRKRLQLEEEKAREDRIARDLAKERQKQEDYNRWNIFLASPKDAAKMITVEEWVQELNGDGNNHPSSKSSIVSLDTLTSRFDVSLEVTTNRIRQLVQEGRVTGILDEEQGLFIALSHSTMLSLASLVMQKGEASLQDLSRATIDLLVENGQG